jgi:hypothetical protein
LYLSVFLQTLVSFAVALSATHLFAESNAMLAAAMDSVTVDECYEHVAALADDVYEGREAGSRGGHAAATYILRQLEPLGLSPAGTDGKYVQSFASDWRNILALKPGNDPHLNDEVIVVGAHYDHVGYGSKRNSYGTIGKIHNGADDNASGTSALLEIIEAFANSGITTRRSILFAFWDGEERGMWGSRFWVANPTLPLERIKLAVTLDMVGRLRDDQLYVLGTRTGYGMRRLFSGAVEEPLWLDFSWELHENSDHWSFLEKRIPSTLVHTGLHEDYHRPSDDVDKINRQGIRDVSRYLLVALIAVANEDRLPKYRMGGWRDTLKMQRELERPLPTVTLADWPADQPRPRLGIAWRQDAAEPGSVFLTRVVSDTPAAEAGLAVLDRIYELNGQPFADAGAFQSAIVALLDAGTPEFTLLTERRGHVRTVTVKMSQKSRVESREPEQPASGS